MFQQYGVIVPLIASGQSVHQEMHARIQDKYQSGSWKDKNQLLNGFIAATGYERKYAIKLLTGKTIKGATTSKKRGKPAYYDEAVIHVLEML